MEPIDIRRSVRLDGFDYTTADSYFITICTQHKEHRFGYISDGVMHLNEAGQMISERILAIPAKFPGTLVDSYVVMPNHIHFILTLLGYQPTGDSLSNGGSVSDGGLVSDGMHVGAAHRGRPLSDRQGRLVSDGMHVGAAHRGRPLSDRQGRPGTLPIENDRKITHISDDSDWLGYGVSGPIGPRAGGHDGPPLHIHHPAIDQPDDSDEQTIGNVLYKVRNVPSVADVVGWFKASATNYYIKGVKEGRYPAFDRRLWQRNYYEHIIRTEAAYNQIDEYIRTNPVRWGEDRLR
ncbi:MAG: hypothetical protein EOO39_03420 [Cytophagaceae bacterium]|nr:MAG: hypothetical protein EOO39_03420 [Cytophagaceae bacterium]